MLVYGDIEASEQPGELRRRIRQNLRGVEGAPAGRGRHERLVTAFIELSALLQGLADRAFEQRGVDDVSLVQQAGAALLQELAQVVRRSWDDDFAGVLLLPQNWRARLGHLDCPGRLRVKRPEGYTFYALYPEAYIEAAERSGLSSRTVVIGLRSIGLGLAALVSAGLGAAPAFSLRPVGHPFARRVEVAEALSHLILADPGCDFAIVDEGPGLSGSSFGSVADWLESKGVSPAQIHFFPSHRGDPGPEASRIHRQRWASRPRHVVEMDDLIVKTPRQGHRLQGWVEKQLKTDCHDWHDISGGTWRGIDHASGDKPPSDGQLEKRKFLFGNEDRRWLVKFAGLAGLDRQKARKGMLLSAAGFTPRIVGSCHGFLIEEWVDGMPAEDAGLTGTTMIEPVGRYLGFRAKHLPPPNGGASLEALCGMALCNIGEALGTDHAERLRKWFSGVETWTPLLKRVDTDNRLHAWEWLLTRDGRILKTDALDHSGAHDLVGCQDIAWDVAGGCVEFELTCSERRRLAAIVEDETGRALPDELLMVFEICYLGFQIGLWTNASCRSTGLERERIDGLLARYFNRLRGLIDDRN